MYYRVIRISLPLILSFVLLALGAFLFLRPLTHAEPNYDCAEVTEIPQSECEALVALFDATGGSNWINNTNWLVTNTPCSWNGVNCESSSVRSLELFNNNLSGPLPPEIGNLASLVYLHMWGNQITSLPPEIGDPANLSFLGLEHNQITDLPPEIGNAGNLSWLSLAGNQLTNLPSGIGNLTNLTDLYLFNNQIISLPLEIGNLTNLKLLSLTNNRLTDLPPEIGSLANLEVLKLDDNQLINLPAQIGNLTSLTELDLGGNHLANLPAQIGNLSNLESLGVYDNQLGGLPTEIGSITNLTTLDLHNNQLTTLPSQIGNLSNLEILIVYDNQLASLPTEIGGLISLTSLYLHANQLSTLPAGIGSLVSLTDLYLYENQLISLPSQIYNLTNLTYLGLSANLLDGMMPTGMTNLTNLSWLAFSSTSWCVQDTPAFAAWLASISTVHGTGLICGRDPGAISGTISDTDGTPLTAAQAALYRDVGDNGFSFWVLADTVSVNDTGQYLFGDLGQGIDYRVYFSTETNGYAPEYYDDAGQIDAAMPVTVTLGITKTGIDAMLAFSSPPVVDINAGGSSVTVNPADGTVTVNMTPDNLSTITVTRTVTCTGDIAPSLVELQLEMDMGTITYIMLSVGNDQYRKTIPVVDILDDATLKIKTTCDGSDESIIVGYVNLYDPSGYITDANTNQPVVGATVTLYQVPHWRPRKSPSDNAANTCESHDSKPDGAPWSQSAPVDEGIVVNTSLTTVSPLLSHQQTDSDGHYGWDVPEGCWYVVVRADGYEMLTSSVVGIPPEVTDLDLALTPYNYVYLPMITR